MSMKQISVDMVVHGSMKERARETGMKLPSLVSNVLLAWLNGKVYLCPSTGVDATPSAAGVAMLECAHGR